MNRILSVFVYSLRLQVTAIASTYSILVTLFLLLHFTIGEDLRVVAFFNNLTHLLLVPSLVLPVVLLASPKQVKWLWLSFSVSGVVAFVFWYGGNVINLVVPTVDNSGDISVITYNIDGNANTDKVVQTLRDNPADVAMLQEIGLLVQSHMETLSDIYPYQYIIPTEAAGSAILSKYPIVEESLTELGNTTDFRHILGLRGIILVDNQPITIYSVHLVRPSSTLLFLNYDASQRNSATELIMNMVIKEEYPVILGCDCNFSQSTDDYKQFNNQLTDVWRKVGRGLGLTARTQTPLIRSDYVWVSEHFIPLRSRVINPKASDHMPVMSVLGYSDSMNFKEG